MGNYFYHIKPDKIYGKELLSLSTLEEKYPEVSKNIINSYGDRKEILNKKVPLLDCKWKDIIFFSCLDPAKIFNVLEILGLYNYDQQHKILKFSIKELEDKNFCMYKEVSNKDYFDVCSVNLYKEEKIIPSETIQYFMKCAKNNVNPLIFSGVNHILLNGRLDIRKAEVLNYVPILK